MGVPDAFIREHGQSKIVCHHNQEFLSANCTIIPDVRSAKLRGVFGIIHCRWPAVVGIAPPSTSRTSAITRSISSSVSAKPDGK